LFRNFAAFYFGGNMKYKPSTIKETITNSVGSGAIAGIGVGPDGEPGLTRAQQKRHRSKNAALAKIRDKLRDIIYDRRKDIRKTDSK
jgi:hypothetical protein